MARVYRMTPKRRAALRKAQIASARKRKKSSTRLSTGKKIAVGTTVGVVGLVAAQEVYGRHVHNKMVSPSPYPPTLGGTLKGEWAYHAGRGASRRHFAAINKNALNLYRHHRIMTPIERGQYQQYRDARALIRYRNLKGLPAQHGLIHRSGLPFVTNLERRRIA